MKRLVIAFFLIPIIGVFSHALTLSEAMNQVRRNIRDTATTPEFQRYTDTSLTDIINTAQREVFNTGIQLVMDTSFAASAGIMFYTQGPNFIAPLKISYVRPGTTVRIELTEKSLAGLYALNQNWENQTGTPIHYYVRQRPITGGSSKEIGLYPAPTLATAGTVYMTYTVTPENLSDNTDVLFNGASWLIMHHKAVVDYATAMVKQVEGKMDEAQSYFSMATAEVARMHERIGEMPNYNPGIVTNSGANR